MLDNLDAGYSKRKIVKQANEVALAGFRKHPCDVFNGVWGLSVPIMDQNHAVGALTIPFIEHHTSQVNIDGAIEHLIQAAKDISVNWQVPV